MSKGDKVIIAVFVVFIMLGVFLVGRAWENHHSIRHLHTGEKFVRVNNNEYYLLGREFDRWNIEKLPNGFYKFK